MIDYLATDCGKVKTFRNPLRKSQKHFLLGLNLNGSPFKKKDMDPSQKDAQASLDEDLEEPLTLISPLRWAILACFGVLFAFLIASGFWGKIPIQVTGKGLVFNPEKVTSIVAPEKGVVEQLLAFWGKEVKRKEVVAVLEGGEQVVSQQEGTIVEVGVFEGQTIASGTPLFWLQRSLSPEEPLQVAGILPSPMNEQVQLGMHVEVTLASAHPKQYGRVKGVVSALLPFWTAEAHHLFPTEHWLEDPLPNRFTQLVIVDLLKDSTTPSGYLWTSCKGAPFPIEVGTPCTFFITLEAKKPVDYLFP